MRGARHGLCAAGRRLHLAHGPIGIIAEAEGPADEVAAAYRQAVARFEGLLEALVAELPLLRSPIRRGGANPMTDPVARRMWQAAASMPADFVTPMAAVAGAVAEAVLADMVAGRALERAQVNNGGDIALWLAAGARPYRIGVVVDPAAPKSPGHLVVAPQMALRGVATSGRHGRSHSRGIADSVTVLAPRAAEADVAATLIANAVDLPGHPAIGRLPAATLAPDSDLGARLVTVSVGPLSPAEVARALDAGEALARGLCRTGLIAAAILVLGGVVRCLGAEHHPLLPPATAGQGARNLSSEPLKGVAHA